MAETRRSVEVKKTTTHTHVMRCIIRSVLVQGLTGTHSGRCQIAGVLSPMCSPAWSQGVPGVSGRDMRECDKTSVSNEVWRGIVIVLIILSSLTDANDCLKYGIISGHPTAGDTFLMH